MQKHKYIYWYTIALIIFATFCIIPNTLNDRNDDYYKVVNNYSIMNKHFDKS